MAENTAVIKTESTKAANQFVDLLNEHGSFDKVFIELRELEVNYAGLYAIGSVMQEMAQDLKTLKALERAINESDKSLH